MISIKDKNPDREDLIDRVLDDLTVLQAKFPETEILAEFQGSVVRIKLSDAVIFEGVSESGPVIVIDAE